MSIPGKRRSKGTRASAPQRLRLEPLEPRVLLNGVPPIQPDLLALYDSGVHDNDNLTSATAPVIEIDAGQAVDGLNVYREGELLGQATALGGTLYEYTFTDGQLIEGDNSITARNVVGIEESPDSPELLIDLDTQGPVVTATAPQGAIDIQAEILDSLTVTFDGAVDFQPGGSGSFWLDDLAMENPDGPITPTDITEISPNEYEIAFAPQTALGVYSFQVGPDVADLAGNLMDQDQDGNLGEPEEDVLRCSFMATDGSILFWEGFECAHPDWTIDNGIWEVGSPTSGPGQGYQSAQCAATVLSGNYPYGPNSRLVSPQIQLEEASAGQEIVLRFQEYFTYSADDGAYVQVQVYDEGTETWS